MKYKIVLVMIVLGAIGIFAYAQLNNKPETEGLTEDTQQVQQEEQTIETEPVEETKVVQKDPEPQPDHFSTEEDVDISHLPEVYEVRIVGDGFSPASLKIRRGDYVQFVNSTPDSNMHVISNPHSQGHSALPKLNSGIVAPGEYYRFQFTTKGTWGYHDELHQKMTGEIIVE